MKVDNELIVRLAELSRLEFDDTEKEHIKKDLEKILSFMEKLNELNTDNVEPMIYVSEKENVFREDVIRDTLTKEEVLRNAPLKDSDYIKVPKVIQKR